MVLEAILIISGVLILVLAVIMAVFAKWILSDVADDTSSRDSRNRSIISRLWSWLNTSPELLDYRRDKRGRFRKVRRG